MKNITGVGIIRWTARIIGTLTVAFTIFFLIGSLLEEPHGSASGTFDTLMIITFSFWGAGLAGLIFALWKEGLGGIISLVSFIVFNLLVATNSKPDSRYSFILLVFIIPSVLYLYYWLLTRKSSNKIPS
jgi:hypothetical protein